MTRQGEMKLKMTEERRQEFLKALREAGGVFSQACRIVSPKQAVPGASPPAYTTWKTLVERDETFASAVAEVLQLVRDDIHTEIRRRAMEGVQEAVIQKGTQATMADGQPAFVTRYDNKLLLSLARRLDPAWNESRNIQHSVAHDGATEQITSADLRLLTAGQKSNLRDILSTIHAAHGEQKSLTHQPSEQIAIAEDAEYVELDEAEMAFPR